MAITYGGYGVILAVFVERCPICSLFYSYVNGIIVDLVLYGLLYVMWWSEWIRSGVHNRDVDVICNGVFICDDDMLWISCLFWFDSGCKCGGMFRVGVVYCVVFYPIFVCYYYFCYYCGCKFRSWRMIWLFRCEVWKNLR